MAEQNVSQAEKPKLFVAPEHMQGPNDKAVYNKPPDKELRWVTERALERGQYLDWEIYTPQMLSADNRMHKTMLARPYRVEAGQIRLGLSHLRFIPAVQHREGLEKQAQVEKAMKRSFVPRGRDQSGELRETRGGNTTFAAETKEQKE